MRTTHGLGPPGSTFNNKEKNRHTLGFTGLALIMIAALAIGIGNALNYDQPSDATDQMMMQANLDDGSGNTALTDKKTANGEQTQYATTSGSDYTGFDDYGLALAYYDATTIGSPATTFDGKTLTGVRNDAFIMRGVYLAKLHGSGHDVTDQVTLAQTSGWVYGKHATMRRFRVV